MSFFEQVKDVVQGVAKSTGDQIEIAKLNTQIKSLENDQKDLMAEIGRVVYQDYCNGNSVVSDGLKEICVQIEEIAKNINDLNVKVLAYKELKKCSVCGNVININDVFCKKCGERQEVNNTTNDTQTEE